MNQSIYLGKTILYPSTKNVIIIKDENSGMTNKNISPIWGLDLCSLFLLSIVEMTIAIIKYKRLLTTANMVEFLK